MPSPTSAVLVVDVQVGLLTGPKPVYAGAKVVARIATVLHQARAAGCPVIYVQDNDVGPLDSPAWQITPALAPAPTDPVIRKAYGDSFYGTELDALLQQRGITQLIVVGCKTDACVDITSRRAVSLGYAVTLVSDAHTTTDNEFLSAPQSIAYYNLVLEDFGREDGFGNGRHWITVQPAHALTFR